MSKTLSPTAINDRIEAFLKNNPNIKEALKLFEISHSQYENALDSGMSFYNSASTQPRSQTVVEGKEE